MVAHAQITGLGSSGEINMKFSSIIAAVASIAVAAAIVGASAGLLQQHPPHWAVRPSASVGWTDPYNPKIVLTFEKTVGQLANKSGDAAYTFGMMVFTNQPIYVTNAPVASPGGSFFFSNRVSRYMGSVLYGRPCYPFLNFTDYTVGLWFNAVAKSNGMTLVSWERYNQDHHRIWANTGGRLDFYNNYSHAPVGKSYYSTASDNTWDTNVWNFHVVRMNPTNLNTPAECWLNATNLAVTYHSGTNVVPLGLVVSNWTNPNGPWGGRFYIGGYQSASFSGFDGAWYGYFNRLMVWDRLLTAQEITNAYLGNPPTNGLRFYYPMTQMVDRTEYYVDRYGDQTFYSHSGILGYEPFYVADPITTGAVNTVESLSADYYNIVCSNIVPGTMATGFLFTTWVSQKSPHLSSLRYIMSFRSNGVWNLGFCWNWELSAATTPSNAFHITAPGSQNGYAGSNAFGTAWMTNWHHVALLYTPTISNNFQFWMDSTNYLRVGTTSNNLRGVNEFVLFNRSYNETFSFPGALYGPRLYYPPPSGDMNHIVSQIYANATSPYNPTNEVYP